LRIRAWRLMFRAALRYLADSERREVERCDMPGVCLSMGLLSAGEDDWEMTGRRIRHGHTVKTVSSP
jgi:hypothetical protein